ncbi:MAG: MoaD/ThiS family protein [Acidimicrobiales bacterium]
MATVRLPTALRQYAGGAATVEIEGATVGEVLAALDRRHPALGRRVLDEQGQVRRHVHVFVGPERMADLGDPVPGATEVTILPAVSGGV